MATIETDRFLGNKEFAIPLKQWLPLMRRWNERLWWLRQHEKAAIRSMGPHKLRSWLAACTRIHHMSSVQFKKWFDVVGELFGTRQRKEVIQYWVSLKTSKRPEFTMALGELVEMHFLGKQKKQKGGSSLSKDRKLVQRYSRWRRQRERRRAEERRQQAELWREAQRRAPRRRRHLAKLAPTGNKPWKKKYHEVVAQSIDARINYTDGGGMVREDDS